MRILVIDDKQKHRDSALQTLKGHELVIASRFDQAMGLLTKEAGFDAVLTDMIMPTQLKPGPRQMYNPDIPAPYGFVIALRAAQLGVRMVAMITDQNHHNGPMSAALDYLSRYYYPEEYIGEHCISTGNGVMLFVHAPVIKEYMENAVCHYCNADGSYCTACDENGRITGNVYHRKDWGKVLGDLVAVADGTWTPPDHP